MDELRKRRLMEDSEITLRAMQHIALHSRFQKGSKTSVRLQKALARGGRLDLVDRTLLTGSVHADHAERLCNRYLARWRAIREEAATKWRRLPAEFREGLKTPTEHEISAEHLRFLTLVHSVTPTDSTSALRDIVQLKEQLIAAVRAVKGLWCLGVLEVEVISLPVMDRFCGKGGATESEQRKLDVCKALIGDFDGTLFENETSHFLVHFHGIISAKNPSQFQHLSEELKNNNQWIKAPRQIELKKLSTHFLGKPKDVSASLKDIAIYITKGGNDWLDGKSYLRYKVGFENDHLSDEVAWESKNWRSDEELKREHAEDGITDVFSLTSHEIVQLAMVIDLMMSLNRTRTGYLVSVGK